MSRTLVSVCAITAGGCSSAELINGSEGELGVARFSHQCVQSGDYACSESFGPGDFELSDRELPRAVAVGSKFGISFVGEIDRARQLDVILQAVSSQDEPFPGVFSVARPVESSFLGLTDSDKLVDYVVVQVEEATELALETDSEVVESLRLKVGETLTLSAIPMNKHGKPLGGALPYLWTLNPGTFAKLEREGPAGGADLGEGGDVRLTGVKEGRALLTVESGALVAQISVEFQ